MRISDWSSDVCSSDLIAPQAPVHVLFVPKTDVATLNDLQSGQAEIVGRLALAAARYAKEQGFAEDGYRIVMNCNEHGGPTVFQIHFHLLAGAQLGSFGPPAYLLFRALLSDERLPPPLTTRSNSFI